jgi:hypothetical protein
VQRLRVAVLVHRMGPADGEGEREVGESGGDGGWGERSASEKEHVVGGMLRLVWRDGAAGEGEAGRGGHGGDSILASADSRRVMSVLTVRSCGS